MGEIGAWSWKEKYIITDIKIKYKDKQIKTHCWCNAPDRFEDFFKAIRELTDLHVDVPGGMER